MGNPSSERKRRAVGKAARGAASSWARWPWRVAGESRKRVGTVPMALRTAAGVSSFRVFFPDRSYFFGLERSARPAGRPALPPPVDVGGEPQGDEAEADERL